RDRIDEETRALYEERSALLRDLLLSEDPETLARQRFAELDRAFLGLLTSNLEEAQAEGNEEAARSLQAIWDLVFHLMEETLPPEIRFLNQLMSTEGETEIDSLLQENRTLVTEQLVRLIEKMESGMREEGAPEAAAERLALVLEKAKEMVGEGDSA
ncbi:MAG: hypothetical protein IMY86_01320, partial [Chloroflexi bacterium]|nr:hypothetical protein [Chloroflexota bacterium]